MDIRHQIDASKMSSYQWLIIAVTTFLNALDGYDVLAMAFTATSVTKEFGLSGTQLGWLLSAGLIGMAVGSLVLGPFADRYGRRKILIVALAINALGLFLSTTANSAFELGLWRIVTGLGVGGILASATVITSEYASARRRGMAVSIFTAGYGVGATLGGMGATQLIPAFGWRSVFLTGGLLTLVAIALVVALIPESVDYLRTRRPQNAVEKLQRIARRMRLEGNVELDPAPISTGRQQGSVATLLSPRYRTASILLWISFFVIMFGFYFANSWTPRLLVESGMTEQQGIIGGLMLTMGGTFGSLLYGAPHHPVGRAVDPDGLHGALRGDPRPLHHHHLSAPAGVRLRRRRWDARQWLYCRPIHCGSHDLRARRPHHRRGVGYRRRPGRRDPRSHHRRRTARQWVEAPAALHRRGCGGPPRGRRPASAAPLQGNWFPC
ncbi:benzoate transport [Pseudarthrobacter sp. SLBN-100]